MKQTPTNDLRIPRPGESPRSYRRRIAALLARWAREYPLTLEPLSDPLTSNV